MENIELSSNTTISNAITTTNNNNFLLTETTSHDMSILLENMNSQQTLELISNLVRNKKHLLKRILDEESDDFTPKRLKNNEHEQIKLPSFDLNLSESFSSTLIRTESNNGIGKLYLIQIYKIPHKQISIRDN